MYCLDTDIAVAFLRGQDSAVSFLTKLQESGVEISTTTLTLCELYRGAFLSPDVHKNLGLVNTFLERVNLLPEAKSSCIIYGQDFATLKKKGVMTQQMDLLIASICKANGQALITRNIRDFKNIPDLVVNSW